MRRVLVFYIFLFTFNFWGFAQNNEYFNTIHYTSESGLPHNLIFSITQDKNGFIWFASNNGLGRFDGYDFKIFRPTIQGNSISGKSVYRLYYDKYNNLWLGIQGVGLDKMNIKTESFTSYRPKTKKTKRISGNNVITFHEDSDSILWIGTNKGLDYYDRNENLFVTCTDTLKNIPVELIQSDNYNRIWFLSNRQLFVYNKDTRISEDFFTVINDSKLINSEISSFIIDKNKIWIGTQNQGLICYNSINYSELLTFKNINNASEFYISKNKDLLMHGRHPENCLIIIPKDAAQEKDIKIYDLKSKGIKNLFINYQEDNTGNVWISHGLGLNKITPQLEYITCYSRNKTNDNLLNDNIYHHFIDKTENLWLSPERKGIIIIDLNQKPFNQYHHFTDRALNGDNISLVFEDSKGNIWVGCHSKGLTKYNPKTNKTRHIPYNPDNNKQIIYKAPSAMAEDANGKLWVGFYDGQMAAINPETFNIKYYTNKSPNSSEYFKGYSIRSIICDNNNSIWFATNSSGLIEKKHKSNAFIYHSEIYENDYSTNSHYRYMTQTKDGVYWTGTQNGGLGKYDKSNHTFIHYKQNFENNNSINSNTVYFIHEESDSILWIGTDKGLNRFNRFNEHFENIPIVFEDGISSIYRIYTDSNNIFWMSGDHGIISFNPQTYSYSNYIKEDGLPSKEFNTTAGVKSLSGQIYLGSSSGLVSFNPYTIKNNPFKPKPTITKLKLFNKTVTPNAPFNKIQILKTDISTTKKITLPNDLNDFTLEFSALHFSSPHKNKYTYKLEGYNSNWIETNSNRRWANYNGLKHGLYTFKLKATNNDGIYCDKENEASLQIEILPHFSETWWFKLFIILALAFWAFIIHKLRVNSIKKSKIRLEEKVKTRTSELHNSNKQLEERQEEIILQNEELEKHRNHLEELVYSRTKELQLALEKSKESDRLKSAFLSNMSHEIRTPMNAIIGFSDLLRMTEVSDDEKNEYASIINENGETLLSLLNDIIDISKIDAHQLALHFENVDIRELINKVFIDLKNQKEVTQNNNLSVKLMNLNAPLLINTDPLRFNQVLNKLVHNAVKYTKSGTISISAKQIKNELLIEVEDTGIGIAKDKVKWVFDRFRKIEAPDNQTYRGSGLGLAICKNVIEQMGGKIWVDSSLGKGSKFSFTINLTL